MESERGRLGARPQKWHKLPRGPSLTERVSGKESIIPKGPGGWWASSWCLSHNKVETTAFQNWTQAMVVNRETTSTQSRGSKWAQCRQPAHTVTPSTPPEQTVSTRSTAISWMVWGHHEKAASLNNSFGILGIYFSDSFSCFLTWQTAVTDFIIIYFPHLCFLREGRLARQVCNIYHILGSHSP